MEDESLPDWSLLGFFDQCQESISKMVSSATDGNGKFVMGLLGFLIALFFFPISLVGFILWNRFKVSTKTWVYFIIMTIVIVVAAFQSSIQ